MIGSFFATLAGKVVLAGVTGTTAVGSLGVAGALPGTLQSSFARGVGTIGINVPDPKDDLDAKAGSDTSFKLAGAQTTSNLAESGLSELGVGAMDVTLLNFGIELAFGTEPIPQAAFAAARSHIESQCNQALGIIADRSTNLRTGFNGDLKMLQELDSRIEQERNKVSALCTKALARADELLANSGEAIDTGAPSPTDTTLPQIPSTTPIIPPSADEDPKPPTPNNPNENTVPTVPSTTLPDPSTSPDTTIPDDGIDYSGPGSGYDGYASPAFTAIRAIRKQPPKPNR